MFLKVILLVLLFIHFGGNEASGQDRHGYHGGHRHHGHHGYHGHHHHHHRYPAFGGGYYGRYPVSNLLSTLI